MNVDALTRDFDAFDLFDIAADLLRKIRTAAKNADQHQIIRAAVLFGDLVRNPHECTTHGALVHDLCFIIHCAPPSEKKPCAEIRQDATRV